MAKSYGFGCFQILIEAVRTRHGWVRTAFIGGLRSCGNGFTQHRGARRSSGLGCHACAMPYQL